jgi:hypothetical protein
VAALAAGNADLRFVAMVRSVPLPDEMKADKEVEAAYFGALDEALEPRKLRGRDAALAGLRAFAEVGALHDPRVQLARGLLTELFSGSRVDALDRLLLPDLPPLDTGDPDRALAARLPTFYFERLAGDADATDPKLVRALLERGVPRALAQKLEAPNAPPAARLLFARALVESGRRYFRSRDFQRAGELLAGSKLDDGGRLLLALAKALEHGPADTSELMRNGPVLSAPFDVSALDQEVARRSKHQGRAEFDAAYVLQLAPKRDDAAFWDDLAARFARAEKLLAKAPAPDRGAPAAEARSYAEAARATAASLRQVK